MSITEHEHPVEVVTQREQRARTLEAAALEIEVRGWTRGSPREEDGPVCLLGGIACALGLSPVLGWRTTKCIFDGHSRHDPTIWRWNDAYARDAADVTFLLRWRAEEIRDGW